jgi:hypothetical protein
MEIVVRMNNCSPDGDELQSKKPNYEVGERHASI